MVNNVLQDFADAHPHREAFSVVLTLRDTTTGVERDYREDWPYDMDGFAFMWGEGNYSCDCNRAMFFARAGNEIGPNELGPDTPCGDSRFTITAIRFAGERTVADEVDDGA